MNVLATAVIAAIVTAVCTPIVRRALVRNAIVDVPNERSSHASVVPRGGGIAVAAGAVVGANLMGWSVEAVVLGAAALALGAVGFVDDRRDLPPIFRLAAQFVIPIVALPILLVRSDLGGLAFAGAVVVGAGWCAAYVNAFNFMDGINGLAVGQTLVAGCALAWMANDASAPVAVVVSSIAVAGAAIGFAPFNVKSASVFLGDVGSYFLGTWLAILFVLVVVEGTPLFVALGPFVLYLLDTGTTLVRRFRRGARLLEAHREHSYQRLVALGWTHAAVASLATLAMAANATLLIASNGGAWWSQTAAIGAALAISVGFVSLPSAVAAMQRPLTVGKVGR